LVVTVAFPGLAGRVGHPDPTQNIGQNLKRSYHTLRELGEEALAPA
jgi:hypothetical protein